MNASDISKGLSNRGIEYQVLDLAIERTRRMFETRQEIHARLREQLCPQVREELRQEEREKIRAEVRIRQAVVQDVKLWLEGQGIEVPPGMDEVIFNGSKSE